MIALHCFPYAGGGASLYRPWQRELPSDIQVVPFRLPGREDRFRDKPFEDFGLLLQHLRHVLAPAMAPPYALFGHSMGALIAFAFAREMRALGLPPPVQLLVSGIQAPQILKHDPLIHRLSDAALLRHVHGLGGTPDQILLDREFQQLFLPLLRSDFTLTENYRYSDEPPLACPLSVWGGTGDPLTTPTGLELWSRQTDSRFRLRLLPGDHQFIRSARAELLAQIVEDLTFPG